MELIRPTTMTVIFLFYPYLKTSNRFQGQELDRHLFLLRVIQQAHRRHHCRCRQNHHNHQHHLHHLTSDRSREHCLCDPHGDLALALEPQDHLVKEDKDRHRAKQGQVDRVDLWMMDHTGPEGKGKF